jgi:hypothetical protein
LRELLSSGVSPTGREIAALPEVEIPSYTPDDLDDLEDAPSTEIEAVEQHVIDQATAARTIAELEAEIAILTGLEELALKVKQSRTDTKWDELSKLLQNQAEMFDAQGHRNTGIPPNFSAAPS